ncbi:MAG TPA: AbrB/MazE/SpoVT family DNA-binding domain-containing protein [Thermomicrobiales bacterium]|nr:AbrB/MazE/SpoVT family DNA-binding domain-containing protein [Thermomicrobiales bacterium]
MLTTKLRRVGGSTMFAVPSDLLNMLDLHAGDTVSVDVENGRLVVEPRSRPRYTLTQLLEASDYEQPQPDDERAWVDAAPVGREPL